MIRKPLRWISAALAVLLALLAWCIVFQPLRRSEQGIRNWLFNKTPLNSNMADVGSFLEERGWNDDRFHAISPPPAAEPFLGGVIGRYQGLPWYVSVRAYWEFDDDGRLVDIHVEKIMDSP